MTQQTAFYSNNVNAMYDTAFEYIKQAKFNENCNNLSKAKELYLKGIECFLTITKYELNISKRQLIKKNVSEFIQKAENIQKKLTKNNNNNNLIPSAPPLPLNDNNNDNKSDLINIPITVIGDNNCISKETFTVSLSYNSNICIYDILNKCLKYLNDSIKYYPLKFDILYIKKESFIDQYISDEDDLLQISNQIIINYNKSDIINRGLIICIKRAKYIHNVSQNEITCKYMIYNKTTNPLKCNLYNELINNQSSSGNLKHLREYTHFCNEFIQKPECKLNQNCESFIRLEEGNCNNTLNDLCHVELYRHPPRKHISHIKINNYLNKFIFNTNWDDNYPVYKPNNDDKIKYKYNKKDGFLYALIDEIINNNFRNDLYYSLSDVVHVNNNNSDVDYSILDVVNDKLNSLRHRAMGSPLNRGEMLSLILYTSCDCNYDLCQSQRNNNYLKWKWFDFNLFFAIFKLSNNEIGKYKLYSGLSNVKLNKNKISNGYFVTYVSATWMKHVAMEFINGEGMIIETDINFRNNNKINCCDVSWISKFSDECEIVIARSDGTYSFDNFTCKVVDERNGIQTVLMKKD